MRARRLGGLVGMLCWGMPAAADTLACGSALTRTLQPGETVEFSLTADRVARGLQLQATESGIDLELRWRSGGVELTSNDGDFPRRGEHRLAANLTPGQTGTVQVRAPRPGSRGGEFSLRTRCVDLDDAADARLHSAELLETEVAQRTGDTVRAGEPASVDAARQLLALRRELGDPHSAARALFLLDQLLRRQNRRAELIVLLEDSLAWLRQAGNAQFLAAAYNNIGMSHWRLGDGRRAEAPLRQALDALAGEPDSLLRVLVDGNLCLVVASRRSVDANLACSLRNRELSEATGDYARIAVAWNNLAGAYSLAGKSDAAAEGYLRGIEFGERAGGRNIADPLMNLGLERFAQGRFEDASELYARAESIYRRDDNVRNLALVLRHQGSLDIFLGNTSRGRALLEEALTAQRRVRNTEDIVRTLLLLGEQERREAARPSIPAAYVEALALAETDAEPRTLTSILLRLIPAQIETNQFEAARSSVARADALAHALHDDSLRSRVQLRRARLLLAEGDSAAALTQIRETLRAAQRFGLAVDDLAEMHAVQAHALAAQQRLPEAARAYSRGIAVVERARAGIRDAEWRARFIDTRRELYEGFAVSLAEHALARNDPALIRDSLAAVAEQRSRWLLDEIGNRADDDAAPTEAYRRLVAREVELASARWLAQERGLPAAATAGVDAEWRDVSAQLAKLERRDTKGTAAGATRLREMNAVIGALAREATIVHYLVATEHSYAWTARGDRVALVRLPGRQQLEPQIASSRALIDGGDGDNDEVMSQLCRSIWEPLDIASYDQPVLIVPDERLHAVPWPALQCSTGNDAAPRELIERAEITLAPSLRAVDEIRRRQASGRRNDARRPFEILAAVDAVYDARDARIAAGRRREASATSTLSLPRLTASAREAAALQQRMKTSAVTVLTGPHATRESFLQLPLERYRLIHLGLHGFVGPASLADSGVAFSLFDSAGAPLSGFLNARSIARLRLTADLVVLAACESAAGRALAGEGLLATHYAFLAAGADQVVAASARVSDSVTSQLMDAFYRELVETGATPARALRAAQLEIRRDPRTRHPRYWAGFAAYGFPPAANP
ncbi:MAG TPA: CHAT domain-containing protein [Tahibacter sp.]|uniref:CHAT domain-containing tetratricopeptide repeat protein n=1 Tax=Tahibacter sp. TaxID=2056211 RepID=UPI002BA162C2|nr:CHAT domain-containing protein [Tahibacter sp.]HSX61411.1 CHAT domain-containing protein [Tahibacter sp.]